MIGMLPQQAKHEQNSKVSLLASETCVRLQAFGRNRGNIAMQSMMPRASPDQAWSDRLDGWMEWNNGTLERWNAGTLERWNAGTIYVRTVVVTWDISI